MNAKLEKEERRLWRVINYDSGYPSVITMLSLQMGKDNGVMWICVHIWEDFRSGRVPERFADHILIGDAVVGQRLTPYRVEGVTQSLGPELIGLNKKTKPGDEFMREIQTSLDHRSLAYFKWK